MSTYPLMVRDKIMAKVKALPFFTGHGFHFHTNKSVQIQPQNIPFCGVYLIEETGIPDGDANVGETRLRTTVRYGFSVIVQNNDPVAAENKLDEAMQSIHALFADPTLYDWRHANEPGHAAIQAFSRGSRTHQFGSIGADNEIPIAELRYDLTCDLGSITYPPTITDNYNLLHFETSYPSPDKADGVQQTTAVWETWMADTLGARIRVNSTVVINADVMVI